MDSHGVRSAISNRPPSAPALALVLVVAACSTDRAPGLAPGGDSAPQASGAAPGPRDKEARAAVKELSVDKLPAGAAVTIDGRLDEPSWQSAGASKTGPFVNVGSGKEDPSQPAQGEARLLWDDAFLYVAFEVRDKTVTGGFPPGATDPHLWERDTVEVMLDPDGDGDNRDYYEIQINPQNLVFDTRYDNYNSPNGNGKGPFGHEEWSAGVVSAVALDGTLDDDADEDRGYTVEAKIPWASFAKAKSAPPAPGDSWRMNFYAMQNNGGTAWSPILGDGNFHRARRFGRVRFLGSSRASAAAPASAAAAARPPAAVVDSAKAAKPAAAPPGSGNAPGFWAGPPDR
jgi:hypothetical protein